MFLIFEYYYCYSACTSSSKLGNLAASPRFLVSVDVPVHLPKAKTIFFYLQSNTTMYISTHFIVELLSWLFKSLCTYWLRVSLDLASSPMGQKERFVT